MQEERELFDSLILDIDGTIWNTTGIVAVAWNRAIDMCGIDARKVNAQDLQKEFGKTMDVIAHDLWPKVQKKEREVLLSYCCTEEHVEIRKVDFDITYPGVIDAIKKVSQVVPVFVVSNCQSGYIEIMLEKTGLTSYVKDFECYGRTGKGKAENLQILIQRNFLHSPVYVGDTQSDADACAQAGVPFVFAEYGFGECREESCVARIKEFGDIFSVLGR